MKKRRGVSSGYTRLDRRTDGFHRGELCVIAARSGAGKTALGLGIAMNIVAGTDPKPVYLFSLEMSRHIVMERLIAAEAGIGIRRIRAGSVDAAQWEGMTQALSRFCKALLFMTDAPCLSVTRIRFLARRLVEDLRTRGRSLGLIIIDYLQMFPSWRSLRSVSGRSRRAGGLSRLA